MESPVAIIYINDLIPTSIPNFYFAEFKGDISDIEICAALYKLGELFKLSLFLKLPLPPENAILGI